MCIKICHFYTNLYEIPPKNWGTFIRA